MQNAGPGKKPDILNLWQFTTGKGLAYAVMFQFSFPDAEGNSHFLSTNQAIHYIMPPSVKIL